jgi:hypothetical protein
LVAHHRSRAVPYRRLSRALLLAAQTDTSDEAIEALVTAKLERATILDRVDPPDVVALIDELVLHRLIGSPEIMHEQLIHVVELAERPYVCVQVVPTAVGATAGLSGAVNLASGDGSPDVLHTDAYQRDIPLNQDHWCAGPG